MDGETSRQGQVVAFAGATKIAAGPLRDVAVATKRVLDSGTRDNILVFDLATSEPVELDLEGPEAQWLARLERREHLSSHAAEALARGPGRPRLGVVAREITLLPRHWEWLAGQPGGASVALRKLVEEARRTRGDQDRRRQAREATYRFMLAMAGDRVGFEEATRALFADDASTFVALVRKWPADVAQHVRTLSEPSFTAAP